MSRPDYGPTAVVYDGPLSTYMDGSSAAHRRLMAVGRPRPAVEPMSRPDYGPTAAGRCQLIWTVRQRPIVG